ncbi:MAG: SDR family oxidoreductase [Acidobacteria bacterium]|nr:SDR family oxidoreductase [Acidobacteriota bacterium]MBI3655626.1 SDR family oxidoreductase [Acidobacteriota bacterium]
MASKYLDERLLEAYRSHQYNFSSGKLAGRVVLVSGGTGGLGSAFVAWLLSQGGIPVVGYKSNHARAQHVQSLLQSRFSRSVHLVSGNIEEESVRTQYMKVASSMTGVLYGFVCFAGEPARLRFEELTSKAVGDSLAANYIGPVLLAKLVAQALIERKAEGSIIFISSVQGVAPFENSLNYGVPKAALIHAAKILAKQWRKERIRVNVVAPGATVVGMAEASIRSGKYDKYIESQAITRFGYPEDVALTIGLLLQPDGYITGQVITVDGGLSL